jgi:2-polyprenyl-6-methoxyphenol hydroxylase-like FAD-dependent oxidoreductase
VDVSYEEQGPREAPGQVLIVGAGPAGAALAFLLASRGLRVTLAERETNFARVFRGEALMPLGVDALYQMGLGKALSQLPARNVESWEFYVDGARLFRVDEPQVELGDRAARVVSQPALLERLVAEASRHPSFSFLPGANVRELLTEDGRVVGVLAQTADGPRELRADVVIGCDGRGSVVRTRSGLGLALLPESYDVLWFKMPAPERLRGSCSVMMFGSVRHTALCYTSWDDRLQYALLLPKGGYKSLRLTDWAKELGEPLPGWLAEHVLAVRDRLEGPVRLNVLVGRCPRWSTPGLLLLGDAAHPMSPVRAQGINIALRDALVAANHLVPIFGREDGPDALDAALRAAQEEREPEVVRAQTLQLRETRGQANTRLRPVMIATAKLLAPVLGRTQWARRRWLRQQHDLRFGSTDVRLRV